MNDGGPDNTMMWEIVGWLVLVLVVLMALRAWVNPNDSMCNFEVVRHRLPGMCEGWVG